MKIKIVHIVLLAGLISSCGMVSKRKLDPEAYLKWYSTSDNQFRLKEVSEDVEYVLSYKPLEYEIAKCAIRKCQPSDTIKSYLKQNDQNAVFGLKVQLPNSNLFDFLPGSEISKSQRMEYFSFGFKEDIYLVTKSKDTVDCQMVYYERSPSDFPVGKFELVFPSINVSSINEINIANRAISNTNVSFFLKDIDKKDIPKLRL